MVAIASLPTTSTRRPSLAVAGPAPAPARDGAGRSLRSLALVAVLALAVVAAVAYLVITPSVGVGAATPATGTHVADADDTMWSIAVEHAPAGEAAGYVEVLVAANGGASITAGQVVTLPAP